MSAAPLDMNLWFKGQKIIPFESWLHIKKCCWHFRFSEPCSVMLWIELWRDTIFNLFLLTLYIWVNGEGFRFKACINFDVTYWQLPLELMYSVEFPQIPYITVGDGASMDTGSISKRFPLCFMLFVQTIAKIKVETALWDNPLIHYLYYVNFEINMLQSHFVLLKLWFGIFSKFNLWNRLLI